MWPRKLIRDFRLLNYLVSFPHFEVATLLDQKADENELSPLQSKTSNGKEIYVVFPL